MWVKKIRDRHFRKEAERLACHVPFFLAGGVLLGGVAELNQYDRVGQIWRMRSPWRAL